MKRTPSTAAYLALTIATAAAIAWSVLAGPGSGAASRGKGLTTVRDANVEQILRLIEEGKLSDREAMYYRKGP